MNPRLVAPLSMWHLGHWNWQPENFENSCIPQELSTYIYCRYTEKSLESLYGVIYHLYNVFFLLLSQWLTHLDDLLYIKNGWMPVFLPRHLIINGVVRGVFLLKLKWVQYFFTEISWVHNTTWWGIFFFPLWCMGDSSGAYLNCVRIGGMWWTIPIGFLSRIWLQLRAWPSCDGVRGCVIRWW